MNVGLTRGKYSVIVLGRAAALSGSKGWSALIDDAKSRGLFVSFDLALGLRLGPVLMHIDYDCA